MPRFLSPRIEDTAGSALGETALRGWDPDEKRTGGSKARRETAKLSCGRGRSSGERRSTPRGGRSWEERSSGVRWCLLLSIDWTCSRSPSILMVIRGRLGFSIDAKERARRCPMLAELDTLLGRWAKELMSRAHRNVAVVAFANKLARIAWAATTGIPVTANSPRHNDGRQISRSPCGRLALAAESTGVFVNPRVFGQRPADSAR